MNKKIFQIPALISIIALGTSTAECSCSFDLTSDSMQNKGISFRSQYAEDPDDLPSPEVLLSALRNAQEKYNYELRGDSDNGLSMAANFIWNAANDIAFSKQHNPEQWVKFNKGNKSTNLTPDGMNIFGTRNQGSRNSANDDRQEMKDYWSGLNPGHYRDGDDQL